MVKLFELNDEDLEALAAMPKIVRSTAAAKPPNLLYRLKDTGQRVTIASYCEDGTVTVDVTGEYNLVLHDRNVFGINPDDLEECELPTPDEELGTAMTPEQVDENIEELRCLIRPDLFVMGPDGKAVRKN